jgi:hypothetical protein
MNDIISVHGLCMVKHYYNPVLNTAQRTVTSMQENNEEQAYNIYINIIYTQLPSNNNILVYIIGTRKTEGRTSMID